MPALALQESALAPTVLVVEDDDAVRRFLRTVLEDDGFNVVEAPDGVRALDLADRFPGEIDVLLTDIIMPRMGGGEVAAALALRRPELRARCTCPGTARTPSNVTVAVQRMGRFWPSRVHCGKC